MVTLAATAASDPWDAVEYAVLAAAREPSTSRQVADRTGLTPGLALSQLEVLRDGGLLVQVVARGVRYHLTLAGWKRLSALTDRPGHQAAA